MTTTILVGDAAARLADLPPASAHACVTSPPYFALRRYSDGDQREIGREDTPAAYVERLVAVFREVRRVLHPSGTLWLNLGNSYAGSGKGPTGVNGIGSQEERQGFTNARSVVEGLPPKSLLGIPWRVAFALQDDGWILRSEIIWSKRAPLPESVRDRPVCAHETIFLFAKQGRYFYDDVAVREPAASAGRPINARYGGEKYGDGVALGKTPQSMATGVVAATRSLRNVWHLSPEPSRAMAVPKRVRVSADDADGDTEHIVSPDCPMHAGRRSSTPRRDGPRDVLECRSQHNGTGLVQELLGVDAPTEAPFSEDRELLPNSDAGAAILHSRPLSRMVPDGATNPACTASVQSPASTDDMSGSLDDGSPRLDRSESSTASADSSGGLAPRSPADSVGNVRPGLQAASPGLHDAARIDASSISAGSVSDARGPLVRTAQSSRDISTCTCSFFKVIITDTSHYASFPTEIPRRAILAGTSARGVCPACRAPWERVVERAASSPRGGTYAAASAGAVGRHRGLPDRPGGFVEGTVATTGWRPTCRCDAGEPIPATVLDPFLGSGTTLLVADRLGRNGVGVELNPEYARMAEARIHGDAPLLAAL